MFGYLKKAANRAMFEMELVHTVKEEVGILMARLPLNVNIGLHDAIMQQLESSGEPFNKHDYVAMGLVTLALLTKSVMVEGMNGEARFNLAFLAYVVQNFKNVNKKTRGVFDIIRALYEESPSKEQKSLKKVPNDEIPTPFRMNINWNEPNETNTISFRCEHCHSYSEHRVNKRMRSSICRICGWQSEYQ